ncbi:type II toxin-antitoxin system HigB family toxin [Cellulophaga sp. HaHa_2_95]|uniref:type II toxin-antitoxin system HigB family toxin n=1 Tax=unclassified Cellulophaga TaxID=2634405 RepID=UPI001C4FB2FD|nr:type II toxin-antitoxin system HigB family toxin [Cellulophaga sp. HaHa_2_95]QXP55200.1 type II toxin-antitoxin system HigB family toxin [Cellulophaga sp. HaHa_2_95]
MRIYSRGTLKRFWIKYPESKDQLLVWYDIISKNEYKNSNEIKVVFGSADYVKNGKIVFNICGNKYRLIVKINYTKHLVFVLFVGTHKEYDKIDVTEL